MTIPDLPDNYPWLPGSERFPVGDLGEIAVRLGSPVRFDRRGEVLWYDQFDYGLAPWSSSVVGDGASVKISAANTFMSPYAALLTAGSTALRKALLKKNLQHAALGKWGVELAVTFLSDWDYFEVALAIYTGDTLYAPGFRISLTDGELQYRNDAFGYDKVVDVVNLRPSPPQYHHVKLVFDLSKAKYNYIMLGPNEYDLSDLTFDASASAGSAGFRCVMTLAGRAGQNDTAQVGQGHRVRRPPRRVGSNRGDSRRQRHKHIFGAPARTAV